MRELDETAGGGPIGARLAAWRRHRELTGGDLASRTGLGLDYLAGLETGREWVDRRGPLAALTAALRLDVADLTGQPYPPRGEEHAAVRAVAFHLRRRLDRPHPGTAPWYCWKSWPRRSGPPRMPRRRAMSTVSRLRCRT